MINPALLAVTRSNSETLVLIKLNNHSYHVLIWKQSQTVCMLGQDAVKNQMPLLDRKIDKK